MKKIRLIQTRFINLKELKPSQIKKRNSQLQISYSNIISMGIMAFRNPQIVGKLLITSKGTYRIIETIGPVSRRYYGKFYEYAVEKV